jgi:hypothetical protein
MFCFAANLGQPLDINETQFCLSKLLLLCWDLSRYNWPYNVIRYSIPIFLSYMFILGQGSTKPNYSTFLKKLLFSLWVAWPCDHEVHVINIYIYIFLDLFEKKNLILIYIQIFLKIVLAYHWNKKIK